MQQDNHDIDLELHDSGDGGRPPATRRRRDVGSLLSDDFICVGLPGFMLSREQYRETRRSGDL
jgi:hypothetical protein